MHIIKIFSKFSDYRGLNKKIQKKKKKKVVELRRLIVESLEPAHKVVVQLRVSGSNTTTLFIKFGPEAKKKL